ncbi:hypothetical protein [Streptomyces sp. NPDC056190]|uniref:hypothetical protein n=1 Tax=unclassified Streptomyces TaxID=2593676 RepID=UPI0035D6B341
MASLPSRAQGFQELTAMLNDCVGGVGMGVRDRRIIKVGRGHGGAHRQGSCRYRRFTRDRPGYREVVRQAEKAGGNVIAVQLDLAEPSAAEQLLATAERHLGGLDIFQQRGYAYRSRAHRTDG